jgi:hypothetical protein
MGASLGHLAAALHHFSDAGHAANSFHVSRHSLCIPSYRDALLTFETNSTYKRKRPFRILWICYSQKNTTSWPDKVYITAHALFVNKLIFISKIYCFFYRKQEGLLWFIAKQKFQTTIVVVHLAPCIFFLVPIWLSPWKWFESVVQWHHLIKLHIQLYTLLYKPFISYDIIISVANDFH